MIRRVYRGIVRLHPAGFRKRFGEEMLAIFDQAGDAGVHAAWWLVPEAFLSLVRQWVLRSALPILLLAFVAAAFQIGLGGAAFRATVVQSITDYLVSGSSGRSPHEAEMYLLFLAGAVAVIMLAATMVAVWCLRSVRPVGLQRRRNGYR